MKRAALAAALLLLAPRARAAFEDLGAGARAPGMGNAFTALADDAYAVYYNPAGLTQLERPQFSASYAQLYTGLNDGSNLGVSQLVYAQPLKFGREGTLGFGWQHFALSSLYTEQTLGVSYGRTVLERENGSRLLAGVNLKYLQHSFGSTPEATNAIQTGSQQATGENDPVLTGTKSKGSPDLDLGFLYRLPRRFQFGMLVEHLMQPNVGFAGSDKVERNIHLGLAYKSLWMSLVGELQANKAPDGTTDKDFTVAAERFFPTLDYGQFGLRGSLGFGSRDWKQITVGGSYRINKIQFDYGFMMPIGTFSTGGTHRLALTLHFGAPNAEDEMTKEVLEKTREARLRGTATGYGYEYQENLRPHSLDDAKLAEVKDLVERGQFRAAQQRLTQLTAGQPTDPSIDKLGNRLDIVAYFYSELPTGGDRADAALLTSAQRFARGQDRSAMLNASYAASLRSADARLDQYLTRLEKETGIKATRIPSDSARGFIDEELYLVEAAHNRGDNDRAVQILEDVLELEPGNSTALERLGSAYFLLRKYPEALKAWERALPLETRPSEVQALRQYMDQAQQEDKKSAMPGGLSNPAAAAPAAAPAPAPVVAALPPAPAPAAAKSGGDPRDVAELYQRGVEFYARGEYLQAAAMFMRILQIDPRNDQARKALERIQRAQSR